MNIFVKDASERGPDSPSLRPELSKATTLNENGFCRYDFGFHGSGEFEELVERRRCGPQRVMIDFENANAILSRAGCLLPLNLIGNRVDIAGWT